jgi:hypothetical protein
MVANPYTPLSGFHRYDYYRCPYRAMGMYGRTGLRWTFSVRFQATQGRRLKAWKCSVIVGERTLGSPQICHLQASVSELCLPKGVLCLYRAEDRPQC